MSSFPRCFHSLFVIILNIFTFWSPSDILFEVLKCLILLFLVYWPLLMIGAEKRVVILNCEFILGRVFSIRIHTVWVEMFLLETFCFVSTK